MKPYKHIQSSKKVLNSLINEARTMDNVKTRLTELNELIKLVNSFEEMLFNKYHTDVVEMLILSRMYHTLIKSNNELNINEFLIWFDKDLRTGKDYIKENIAGFLQGMQMDNSLESGIPFQDSKEDWLKSINSVLNQVKTKIIWTKEWKK